MVKVCTNLQPKQINGLMIISLIIQENADPDVQIDLINFFSKLVPMDNSLYIHITEGKDDMPAHIKSALTNNQISLSIKNNELLLGTWQGLYLFEHRIEKQKRLIILHYLGDQLFLIVLKASSAAFLASAWSTIGLGQLTPTTTLICSWYLLSSSHGFYKNLLGMFLSSGTHFFV